MNVPGEECPPLRIKLHEDSLSVTAQEGLHVLPNITKLRLGEVGGIRHTKLDILVESPLPRPGINKHFEKQGRNDRSG